MDTEVLIVGAGPVGLTLAIDLGRRGIRCILIEQKAAPAFLPKMERCNARTMEIYRRLGIAQRIRDAGYPRDAAMDVFIVLSMIEKPLLHLPYPSVAEAQAEIRACNDGTQPLEPYQLISQYTLEPLLKSIAETLPSVTVRYGCEFVALTQDEAGVSATVRQPDGATATASSCAARATSCSCARRSIAATRCGTAFRSRMGRARGATTTSPTTARPSSSPRTARATSRCIRWSRPMPTWRRCSSEPSSSRSTTRCSMSANGSRTCCWLSAMAAAGSCSPATPSTS
jgi:2-polyprenyl-6-methoxyphenol hydroxylase-like FAD-dependent oxidoreductase